MRRRIKYFCFFFSSRRRHTRYWRDWSSDVCSSDLAVLDVPRPLGERLQQQELGDREMHFLALPGALVAARIEHQLAAHDALGLALALRPAAVGAAQDGADALEQQALRERLADEIVGAHAQAQHLVDLLVLGGEEDHGELLRLADLVQQLHAVHARHLDVEDAEVGRSLVETFERRGAVIVGLHLEALGFKQHRHGREDVAVVVDQSDVLAHGVASPDRLAEMLAQTGWLPPPIRSAIDNAANAAFFDPTMSDRAVSAPQPTLPQTVRELVRGLDRASLATVLAPGSVGENWPYAVLVALDHDLSPILLMSDLAVHSKAIAADDRVSLLFDGTIGLDQPLTGPRVTLLGRAARSHDPILRTRFLARHPDAGMYADFGDFAFYRVALERAHLVGGFGKISWLSVAELTPARLAGLAEAE